jgi:hypothetical protein
MKERPILFSGPMVRAILDGTKTQTRRVLKPQPEEHCHGSVLYWKGREVLPEGTYRCPYGKPGDRLWVRETYGYYGCSSKYPEGLHEAYVKYHADGANRTVPFETAESMAAATPQQNIKWPARLAELDCEERQWEESSLLDAWWQRKKSIPSIHMPRWASRITLEITGVRVERLQDITPDDAIAEGVWHGCENPPYPALDCFEILWQSINGPDSWEQNPWVWVVEFRRATP